MTRRISGIRTIVAMIGALVCLTASGCDSGGGGSDSVAAVLRDASFVGFRVQPGPGGPTSNAPIPTVFLDQALEFVFDGPIDPTNFGGLAINGVSGQPELFNGIPPVAAADPVPYNPFADQIAAQASFEVRENLLVGPLLTNYVVGRHASRPNVLVIDPVVTVDRRQRLFSNAPAGTSPPSVGFRTNTVYTFRIPQNNGLFISGRRAQPVGVSPLQLPVVLGSFVTDTGVSLTFQSGNSTSPNPIPPRLVSIQPRSGRAGTPADPMLAEDSIIVVFDSGIDFSTIDLLSNFTVRNRDLGNRILPVTLVFNPAVPNVVEFFPEPSWGEGVMGATNRGYDIEVSVGSSFGPTGVTIAPITGRPQGLMGTRIPIDPTSERQVVFRSVFSPGSLTSLAVVESFEANLTGQTSEDAAFTVPLNRVRWNPTDNRGTMGSIPISGDPFGPFTGNPGTLGTRTQRAVLTQAQLTQPGGNFPAGLFSPFDSPPNVLGPPPSPNPQGGSRTQQLLEAVDLGNPRDSIELIEWGPVRPPGGMQVPASPSISTYPQFRAWLGLASTRGGVACGGAGNGLVNPFDNYDLPNLQPIDPFMASRAVPAPPANSGGVLVSNGVTNYTTTNVASTYHPFPLLTPPYDYSGTGAMAPSLLWDINIEPGAGSANFNRYRANGFTPVRRSISPPLSSGVFSNLGGMCETYDNRFTFVSMRADGRSVFLDTGGIRNVATGRPDYLSVQISPDPSIQPAGTQSIWQFEGAAAITNPTTPSGPTTGLVIYWDDISPANIASGVFRNPQAINALDTFPFFRFTVQLRNNNLTNESQLYGSVVIAVIQ